MYSKQNSSHCKQNSSLTKENSSHTKYYKKKGDKKNSNTEMIKYLDLSIEFQSFGPENLNSFKSYVSYIT